MNPKHPTATGDPVTAGAADRLIRAVDRLVGQVAHWRAGRWAAAGPGGEGAVPPTRADQVYALVQRLADRGADAEQRPRIAVPWLGDTILPDQLRVVADDLMTAAVPADTVVEAAQDIDAVRRRL